MQLADQSTLPSEEIGPSQSGIKIYDKRRVIECAHIKMSFGIPVWQLGKVTNSVRFRNECDSDGFTVHQYNGLFSMVLQAETNLMTLTHKGNADCIVWKLKREILQIKKSVEFLQQLHLISYYFSEVFNNSVVPIMKSFPQQRQSYFKKTTF